jgi:hypothetical protein
VRSVHKRHPFFTTNTHRENHTIPPNRAAAALQ